MGDKTMGSGSAVAGGFLASRGSSLGEVSGDAIADGPAGRGGGMRRSWRKKGEANE